MKRILFVLIAVLSLPISIYSQNLSAYGVSLGEYQYKVENILENKGKSIKYDTNEEGETLLEISNPSIGDVNFDYGTFIFNKDDKLRTMSFGSYDAGAFGMPGAPWEAQFHRKANECKNAFLTMAQNLQFKYGAPSTYTDTSATWQRGNQRISLEYVYKFEYNSYNTIDSYVSVRLTYKLINPSDVDY